MRALASHRGGKTHELSALPASSLGLSGDPPAEQNKRQVQRKPAGAAVLVVKRILDFPMVNSFLPLRLE
jgi:hypothetical protein